MSGGIMRGIPVLINSQLTYFVSSVEQNIVSRASFTRSRSYLSPKISNIVIFTISPTINIPQMNFTNVDYVFNTQTLMLWRFY